MEEHPAVGPVGGGRSALFIYLKDDLSIVVLTNLMSSNPNRFIDEIAGYYIPDMHEANGFGLAPDLKKLRDKPGALINYKRSIRLNPNNKNAADQIKKLASN